jgi:hypothetical protein
MFYLPRQPVISMAKSGSQVMPIGKAVADLGIEVKLTLFNPGG